MSIKSSNVQPCFGYCIQSVLILLGWCHQSSAMRRMCVLSIYILWKNSFTTRSYIFVLRSGRSVCVLSRFRRPFMRAIFVWVRLPLADCPTQLTLILSLWYLYLSVFHDKCQSYKYEKIQQGNLLEGPSLYGWPNLEYGIWLKRNITSSSPQQWQMFCNDSCVISCFQMDCLFLFLNNIFPLFFLSKHQCSRRAGSHGKLFSSG